MPPERRRKNVSAALAGKRRSLRKGGVIAPEPGWVGARRYDQKSSCRAWSVAYWLWPSPSLNSRSSSM